MTWYEVLMLLGIPSVISAILIMAFKFIIDNALSKIKFSKDDHENLKYGVQALLRDRLMLEHDEYTKKGWIDVAKKDNYDNMYKRYHNLGQNGVMDGMHAEVMALPTVKPEPKKKSK